MLLMDDDLRASLQRMAVAAYPHEGCGILLAAPDSPQRVRDVWSLPNAAADPRHRFAFDPLLYMRREQEADRAGLMVVAIWHSHPDGRAVPSEHDRQEAWPDWSYVIVATAADRALELRSWRLSDDRFQEETIRP